MSKSILVVDDDATIREVLRKGLEREGFEVITACDGDEAIEYVNRQLPDLVICDVMMPKMNGYKFRDYLRRNVVTAAIPFIFLTAKDSKADIRKGMSMGGDDYLTKPFRFKELLQSIHARFQKQEALNILNEKKLKTLRDNIGYALPHELRTPLTAIITGTDFLLAGELQNPEDDQKVKKVAGMIRKGAQRLYRLIQNYELYAKVELMFSDPEKRRELCKLSVSNAATIIQYIAQRKATQFKRPHDLELRLVNGGVMISEEGMTKVMEELVKNAFDFSSEGTNVIIQSWLEDEWYICQITNQGVGMTPDQIANIGAFMQFKRGQHEQQGSGLGLTIAKRLLELHEGKLQISSPAEGQTCVTIWLRRKMD